MDRKNCLIAQRKPLATKANEGKLIAANLLKGVI